MSSREQVLIIDDDEKIRDLLVEVLTREGYSCRAFGDAREALSSVDKMDLIAAFVDIHMPEMDGLEFLRLFRRSHTDLPVIVITGFSGGEIFRQTLKFRIADFLTKPLVPQQVTEALQRALGRDDNFAEQFLDTVTHRLRDARQQLRLKQSEVAARCGMSTSQVSQIELRQSSPSITALLKLCKALNLTMTDLVEGF